MLLSKPSRPILIGLLSLSLMLSLTGCSTTKHVPVVAREVRELPPAHLLQDCPEPAPIRPVVNSDLLLVLNHWRNALRACNADKAALRAWAAE